LRVRLSIEVDVDREREMRVCGEKGLVCELPSREDERLLAKWIDVALPTVSRTSYL
jgi:hypothetical protein